MSQKRNSALRSSLLFSTALHLCALAILSVIAFPWLKRQQPTQYTQVQVEVIPGGPSAKVESKSAAPIGTPNKGAKSQNEIDLDDLGLAERDSVNLESGTGDRVDQKERGEEDNEGEVYSGVDGYEVARRMGVETDTRIYPVLSRLYDRILNSTLYPEILVQAGRAGRVSVQFEIDSRGKLTGHFFSVRSEDKYLAVHVLRTLKRALREPLNKNLSIPFEPLRLVAHFHFGIYPHVEYFPPQDPPIMKNVFSFYRHVVRNKSIAKGQRSLDGRGISIDLDVVNSIDALIELFSDGEEGRILDQVETGATPQRTT